MATLANTPRTQEITLASATAGPFDITLRLFSTDLRVTVNDVETEAYSIIATFADGYEDDATITFDSALEIGDVVVIDPILPPARDTNYSPTEPSLTSKLNIELVRIWSVLQQFARDFTRSLKLPSNAAQSKDIAPPTAANQIFSSNSDNTGFVFGPATTVDLANAEANATAAAASAAAAALYDGPKFDTPAILLADETLDYSNTDVGTIIETRNGFAYEVAASSATDHHVTTAGGVKLYAKANQSGAYNAKAFGAVGDGVADDTTAIQAAADAGNASGGKVIIPKGTYRLTSLVIFYSGMSGDGVGRTILQAVNDGTKQNEIYRISGAGVYEGFTLDCDVSADPGTWDASNFDSFTGWVGVYVRADNVTVRNCRAQNVRRAGFNGWDCENVVLENCETDRTRGKFGDGFFFFFNAKNITHINCRAYDFTRIGFVFDGDATNPSIGCEYTNCKAEYGHDGSEAYSDTEINGGFWMENARDCALSSCYSLNTGSRGFRVAIGSGSTIYGAAAGFSFDSCFAENDTPPTGATIFKGFDISGLSSVQRGSVKINACATQGITQGFEAAQNADVFMTGCAYTYDGGDDQSRAITVQENAALTVDGFRENWTTKPADYSAAAEDTASIGSFAGAATAPLRIEVSNYTTVDGSAAVVKQRIAEATNQTKYIFKDCNLAVGTVYARGGFSAEGCTLTRLAAGMELRCYGSFFATKCKIDAGTGPFFVVWNEDTEQLIFDNCAVKRSAGGYIYVFRVGSAGDFRDVVRLQNVTFEGDLEIDDYYFRQSADGAIFNTPGQDLFFDGCNFRNTGGATTNNAVEIDATALAGCRAYFYGCWRSSSITNMAKTGGFIRTNSTFNDL